MSSVNLIENCVIDLCALSECPKFVFWWKKDPNMTETINIGGAWGHILVKHDEASGAGQNFPGGSSGTRSTNEIPIGDSRHREVMLAVFSCVSRNHRACWSRALLPHSVSVKVH